MGEGACGRETILELRAADFLPSWELGTLVAPDIQAAHGIRIMFQLAWPSDCLVRRATQSRHQVYPFPNVMSRSIAVSVGPPLQGHHQDSLTQRKPMGCVLQTQERANLHRSRVVKRYVLRVLE